MKKKIGLLLILGLSITSSSFGGGRIGQVDPWDNSVVVSAATRCGESGIKRLPEEQKSEKSKTGSSVRGR